MLVQPLATGTNTNPSIIPSSGTTWVAAFGGLVEKVPEVGVHDVRILVTATTASAALTRRRAAARGIPRPLVR